MYSSQAIYPYHQNVLWTLLIALCAMRLAHLVREKLPVWLGLPAALGVRAGPLPCWPPWP